MIDAVAPAVLDDAQLRRSNARPLSTRPAKRWLSAVLLVLLFNLGVSPVGGRSAQAQSALPAGSQTEASESVELTESERATPAHPRVDRRETLLASLTIFVLAIFLGFELITKVPPTLHTPLMSGSNAISGITVVGAILATGVTTGSWAVALWGALAIILATINVFGGFAVTHRMLAMFRRK